MLNASPKQDIAILQKESVQQALKQVNDQDTPLYNAAIELFSQRYQAMIDDLKQYLEQNEKLSINPTPAMVSTLIDRRYRRLVGQEQDQTKSCQPHDICYTFDQPLTGKNWHQRESSTKSSTGIFRWTGPGKVSTIHLAYTPTKKERLLLIHILDYVSIETILQARFFINGEEIHPIKMNHSKIGKARCIIARIPKSSIDKNHLYTELKIECPDTLLSSSRPKITDDDRLIGLNISKIEIIDNTFFNRIIQRIKRVLK